MTPPSRGLALAFLEQQPEPVHEVPQRLQLGRIVQHHGQVGPLLLARLVPPPRDQPAVLEVDADFSLLRRRPLGPRLGPPRLPLAAPVAPPRQPPAQAADGVEDVLVEFLEDMEDTELVAGIGPELRARTAG